MADEPIELDVTPAAVTVEPEEARDSVMVTVTIYDVDGTSWDGTGRVEVEPGAPVDETLASLIVRTALGAAMAHSDGAWLSLRRMWTSYPS